jgi:hypothetical protein
MENIRPIANPLALHASGSPLPRTGEGLGVGATRRAARHGLQFRCYPPE